MPMWKVEQCMEMFFCSTGIYLLLHYSMLSTVEPQSYGPHSYELFS